MKRFLFFAISLLGATGTGLAQKQILGNVVDSASLTPMPGVNIHIKNKYKGTATDAKGFFKITVAPTDTLLFSYVGYKMEAFAPVDLTGESLIVRLAQQPRLLDAVTIVAKSLQGGSSTPIHLRSKAKLMNYSPYGVGFSLSYFSKEEKEKAEIGKNCGRTRKGKNYLLVVCSPEIKARIMEEYSITDTDYYDILVKFNEQSTSRLYDLTPEELIVVFTKFYQSHVFKK